MHFKLLADGAYCLAMLVILGLVLSLYYLMRGQDHRAFLEDLLFHSPGRVLTVLCLQFGGGLLWALMLLWLELHASAIVTFIVTAVLLIVTAIQYLTYLETNDDFPLEDKGDKR